MAGNQGTSTLVQDFVCQRPGESTREVARGLGLSESTADYHLRRLQRRGHLVVHESARERWWYPAGRGYCPILRLAVPVLRREGALAVALALGDTPATAATLARAACVPTGRTRWVADRLAETLLAQKSRAGLLSLRDGAEVCREKAARAEPCDRWGRCPLAAEWEKRMGATPGTRSAGRDAPPFAEPLAVARRRLD